MVTTMFGAMLGAAIGGLITYDSYLWTKVFMSF